MWKKPFDMFTFFVYFTHLVPSCGLIWTNFLALPFKPIRNQNNFCLHLTTAAPLAVNSISSTFSAWLKWRHQTQGALTGQKKLTLLEKYPSCFYVVVGELASFVVNTDKQWSSNQQVACLRHIYTTTKAHCFCIRLTSWYEHDKTF